MPQNRKIIHNLFYYLQAHLFGADPDKGDDLLTNGQFGVMMTPGQFVNPNLQEADGSVHMWSQWELLNEVMDTSFAYKPLTSSISRQYRDALENVALPNRPLTPAEELELENIGKWLQQYLPAYRVFRERYFDAFEAYEQERTSQNPNQGRLQRLHQRMRDAYARWDDPYGGGNKTGVESKRARSWQIQTGNPSRRWVELNATMLEHRRNSPRGFYYQTFLLPPISTWSSANWATFTKTITETETHNYSRSVSWSGGFSANWGLFNRVSVGANGEKTVKHDVSDVTTIDVTFDYLRVRIQRPWLESDIFSIQDWTWIEPNTWRYLSDGGNLYIDPPIRPIGTLPFIQKHLIVVRNVQIRADFSHSDVREVHSRISGSASAGFGFFSVRGSYTETTHQVDVRATFDGTTLRIPNPQIVGFLGTLVPKSPNPPADAPTSPYWPPNAVYPPDMPHSYKANLDKIREEDADRLKHEIEFMDKETELRTKLREDLDNEWEKRSVLAEAGGSQEKTGKAPRKSAAKKTKKSDVKGKKNAVSTRKKRK